MGIREIFVEILEQYPQEYEKDNKVSSPYYRNLKERIEQTFEPICAKYGLSIKALGGQGVMRKHPYICFLAEGHRTNKGIYPNYHFDLERQIITVGIGDADEHSPSAKLTAKLSTYASELLSEFPLKDHDGYPEKEYSKSDLSNLHEETLLEDLERVVEVHQLCLEEFDEEIQEYLYDSDSEEPQRTNNFPAVMTSEEISCLIDQFLEWYGPGEERWREESIDEYLQFSKDYFTSLSDEEFIELMFRFAYEGGKIQSGGHRTAGMFRESIEAQVHEFRKGILEIFDEKFDLEAWWHKMDSVKGFGQGIRSIFLHRVFPERFTIFNNKSREAYQILGLLPKKKPHGVFEYGLINEAARKLVAYRPDALNLNRADAMTHFLLGTEEGKEALESVESNKMNDDATAEKADKLIHYWKIAPGEQARKWDEWRDNGFIGIGWEELGDVSQLSRTEFKKKRDELVAQYPDWNKGGVDQVWKFSRIKEGDRIIANKGTTEVLGIGTVTGSYYFVSGVEYGHRLPVEWDDVRPRQVEKAGWRRTLIELDRDDFEVILHAHSIVPNDDCTQNNVTLSEKRQSEEFIESVFQQHYPNPDERKICATLLADSILHAGSKNPSCWGVTLRDNHLIRLNVGKIEVLRLHRERMYLVVDAALLDVRIREQFQNILEFSDSYYLSVSGEQGYGWIPSNQLSSILDKLKTAYFALIEHAAQTVVTQSPYHEAHSPGILKYLRRFLQRDLPAPAYSSPEEKPSYVMEQPHSPQYWWLNAKPTIWDFDNLAVGQKDFYTSHNEQGNKRQIYTAFEQAKPGDLVIGYVTSPRRQITAICRITQGIHAVEHGNVIEFEKLEQFQNPVTFDELKSIPELQKCRPILNNQGSLFPLTAEEYEIIRAIIDEQNSPVIFDIQPEYPLEQCSEESGFRLDTLQTWKRAIERKKQAILYGPPGTGKTFIAEQLARHLTGGGNGFLDIVQFHPAYSYEDFIQGIRPKARDDGGLDYPTVDGRFLQFCKQAEKRDGICVLIIDEINRANLSRVFGELMYLLEYREKEVVLASGEHFRIPENVRIIGTMNTADRSIALVDYALRRRFAFLALHPNYEVLRTYHQREQTGFPVGQLISVLNTLNIQIADSHYEVGISFFLRERLSEELEDIWQMEIEPYLEEYFFDQPEKVEDFRWEKIQAKVLSS